MKQGIRNEQTIVVMLLLGLAAALGFFDIAFAEAEKKTGAPKAIVDPQLSTQTVAQEPSIVAPPMAPMTMLFAGDVMLSRHIDTVVQQAKDPVFSWRLVLEQTSAADLFFVNLEAPFSEKGPYDNDDMVFAVRPEYITGFVEAGVDVVSFANNHYRDAGAGGVETTKRILTEHGIAFALPGEPAIVTRAGRTIGIVASAYNLGLDENVLREDIASVRAQGATIVVASMHAGVEYARTPSTAQQHFARAAIDAGADIVVGHHPHVTQTTENYRSGFIVYSLGNFIFDQYFSAETMHSNVLRVTVDAQGVISHSLQDVGINRKGQPSFVQ